MYIIFIFFINPIFLYLILNPYSFILACHSLLRFHRSLRYLSVLPFNMSFYPLMYLKLQQMQAQIEQPEKNIKLNTDTYSETPNITFFVLKISIRVICHHINNEPGDSITITFLNVIVSPSTLQTYFNI